MSRIEDEIRKIAAGMSKGNSPTSSNTEEEPGRTSTGDPDCPLCQGMGFLRRDLPIDHPDFGRMSVCECRQREVRENVHRRLFSISNLNALRDMTFDSFQPRGHFGLNPDQSNSLQAACNSARNYAGNLNGWLLMTGTYGCGKTHLAAAIANQAVGMGVPTLFLTVPDLLDWMRFAYEDPTTSFESRFEEIRTIRLLVMDDFGTHNATPWAQEKLFQILNYRYVNRLPVVVTTNLALEQIEDRIQSRLRDTELVLPVTITAPDFRNPRGSGQPELSSLHLHINQSFENFSLRRGEGLPATDVQSLEKAFQAAQEFARTPRGWLVFTGGSGCGKTHLAAAIGNYRAALEFHPIFVVVPDLLDHLRSTFSPNSNISLDHAFDEVRTADLLILDDLGTQSTTPWAREKLYQLFNYRYNAQLPTIITTANPVEDLEDRLRSRMFDRRLCTIFGVTVEPFYRTTLPDNKPRRAARRT